MIILKKFQLLKCFTSVNNLKYLNLKDRNNSIEDFGLSDEIKNHPNGWFEYKMNRFDAKNDSFIGFKFTYPLIVVLCKF